MLCFDWASVLISTNYLRNNDSAIDPDDAPPQSLNLSLCTLQCPQGTPQMPLSQSQANKLLCFSWIQLILNSSRKLQSGSVRTNWVVKEAPAWESIRR